MAVTNSWLEYKKQAEYLKIPEKSIMDLIHFRQNVAEGLILAGKMPNKKRGRPSSAGPLDSPASNSAGPSGVAKKQCRPVEDIRYDNIDHFPKFCDNIGRCKSKKCMSRTYIQCTKCEVSLCVSRNHNCFVDFHQK